MAGMGLTVERAYFRKVYFLVPLFYYNIYIFEDGKWLFSKVAICGFRNCRTLQDRETLVWFRPMSARFWAAYNNIYIHDGKCSCLDSMCGLQTYVYCLLLYSAWCRFLFLRSDNSLQWVAIISEKLSFGDKLWSDKIIASFLIRSPLCCLKVFTNLFCSNSFTLWYSQ